MVRSLLIKTNSKLPDSVHRYQNLRVTVLGLGTFGGGAAVARFLAEHGARVTVTDLRSEADLADVLASLDDVSLAAIHTGGHPDDAFSECQLLVVNPAVKPGSPFVAQCRQAGVTVSSEIEIFLHHCLAKVIAVTGSNGKSTTAALINTLLQANGSSPARSFLGGNIGQSLLPVVEELTADDTVVLELSSFQLEQLRHSGFAPSIAVLTNFTPNHLDWHGDVASYRSAKQVLFQRQRMNDVAILPEDLEVSNESGWRIRGQSLRFSTTDSGEDGVYLEQGHLVLRRGKYEEAFRMIPPNGLPGKHNAANIAAASCAAWCAGADPLRFAADIAPFQPLPHRLQCVAQGGGVAFFNDSVATTPESAIAAMQSFSGPVVLIAGGADKGCDYTHFGQVIASRAAAAVLIGDTAAPIESAIRKVVPDGRAPDVRIAEDFSAAFSRAVALVPQGGIVLLSPGCASYGWFRDYRDRGDQFIKLAQRWVSENAE